MSFKQAVKNVMKGGKYDSSNNIVLLRSGSAGSELSVNTGFIVARS